MPKPSKGPRLGGSPAHERLILANLASQLFEHGRITTTEHRAKRVQPLAERLITKAKRGDLHARRLVMRTVRDPNVVHHLFESIAPKLADRPGGCTRIVKIGHRKGDNAAMAVIEVVTETVEESRQGKKRAQEQRAKQSEQRARATGRPVPAKSDQAPADPAPVDPAVVEPSPDSPASPGSPTPAEPQTAVEPEATEAEAAEPEAAAETEPESKTA